MAIFGGELTSPFRHSELFASGRSSLRRIIEILGSTPRILIPNYVCPVVFNEFEKTHAQIQLYSVSNDFEIDLNGIDFEKFDCLYVVHYFGKLTNLPIGLPNNLLIIHDCVFLPSVDEAFHDSSNKQIGFNSFRKIFPCAEGSVLVSNFTYPQINDVIFNRQNEFSKHKMTGLRLKQRYIESKSHDIVLEHEYLDHLLLGEKIIDKSTEIETTTDGFALNVSKSLGKSIHGLIERLNRLEVVASYSQNRSFKPSFACFYPIQINSHAYDQIKKELVKESIYLPYFWPISDELKLKGLVEKTDHLFIPLAPENNKKNFFKC
ncbi:hypothetical protein NI389_14365 [Pseudoalteromonas xiamenensis]|uniref:hypothetical protein n=1 Tax=Pseudoalteromonas xiamenensis TaxID=882626 RepID=UPI0027E55032|nr:hypothetical protein [Pseudoalteromonas xiamenensis]WMN59381.1 hypothetical protein NI389_14365 [Pseudoalteromonas xiamenensis]